MVKKLWLKKYRQKKNELNIAHQENELNLKWLQLSQMGAKFSEYFWAHSFYKVAVFGMNRMGRLVINELGDLVVYMVEIENLGAVHESMTVYRLGDDPLPDADCIVICDLAWTEEKEAMVRSEFRGEVVLWQDVLCWVDQEKLKPD